MTIQPTLKDLIKKMNEEEITMLIHGYDKHLCDCENTNNTPIFLTDYQASEEYQALIETDEIYDHLDYECDLEDATLEELIHLAVTFGETTASQITDPTITYINKLDWFISELEVGLTISAEERIASNNFVQNLIKYGYLPTKDGSLVRPTPDHCFNSLIWEDSQIAFNVLKEHEGEVFVSTYQHEGNYTFVNRGWRISNRLGYFLSSQPLVEDDNSILL